jgi:magnesium transporter
VRTVGSVIGDCGLYEEGRRVPGLVPTAVAGIYGMNFDNMPELRWEYGYFAIIGVILTACLVLHQLFRRNGRL